MLPEGNGVDENRRASPINDSKGRDTGPLYYIRVKTPNEKRNTTKVNKVQSQEIEDLEDDERGEFDVAVLTRPETGLSTD
jgi:hypothetical protein